MNRAAKAWTLRPAVELAEWRRGDPDLPFSDSTAFQEQTGYRDYLLLSLWNMDEETWCSQHLLAMG